MAVFFCFDSFWEHNRSAKKELNREKDVGFPVMEIH
jgi:hypothetical protein